jgi:hypothetical protein
MSTNQVPIYKNAKYILTKAANIGVYNRMLLLDPHVSSDVKYTALLNFDVQLYQHTASSLMYPQYQLHELNEWTKQAVLDRD